MLNSVEGRTADPFMPFQAAPAMSGASSRESSTIATV
jgi:hypothetical protein